MPVLSDLRIEDSHQKLLVFGDPKTGKTKLIGDLAEHGYKLFWMDVENGKDTLFQLSPEAKANIQLYSIRDTHDSAEAAKLANELYRGNDFIVCIAHGKVNCPVCRAKKLPLDKFSPSMLIGDPMAILVLDTLSQTVTSIQSHVARDDDFDDFKSVDKDSKREWGHYMAQGLILDKFLTWVEHAPFKVVVSSHVTELDKEKNPEAKVIIPTGGTSTKSRQVGKYFSHVIYTRLQNNTHSTLSSTTDSLAVACGSRLNLRVTKELGLAAFFKSTGSMAASSPDNLTHEAVEVREVPKDNAKTEAKITTKEAARSSLSIALAKSKGIHSKES